MAYRTTITIPDDLGKRMEAVKRRFNVSGVCQDALEREVRKQEIMLKGDATMEETVKRLSLEKKEALQPLYDDAFEMGYSEAKEMTYEELCEAEAVNRKSLLLHDTEFWKDWLDERTKETAEDRDDFDEDIYLAGWLAGVIKFWEQVKDKI